MGNTEKGLDIILRDGSQTNALDLMQTRKQLYDLTRYEDYNEFDQSLYNFKI